MPMAAGRLSDQPGFDKALFFNQSDKFTAGSIRFKILFTMPGVT